METKVRIKALAIFLAAICSVPAIAKDPPVQNHYLNLKTSMQGYYVVTSMKKLLAQNL